MSAKRFIFARHAQSVTNETNRYQAGDQLEIDPLTEAGQVQAQALADRFSGVLAEAIYASPYLRTRQTAEMIARQMGAQVLVPLYGRASIEVVPAADLRQGDPRKGLLRELDLPPELADLDFDAPAARAIHDQITAHQYEPDWRYDHEENISDIWNRSGDILQFLAERPEQLSVVVSHGGLIKACLARMMFGSEAELDPKEKLRAYHGFIKHTWYDNAGVVSVKYDTDQHSWQWLVADNKHLGTEYFGFLPESTPASVTNDPQNQDVAAAPD